MANIDIASPGTSADALRAALAKQGAGALAQSAVAVPLTGTLTETTLATITIPANTLGANGQLELEALFSYTNSANSKTLRAKFGGTQYLNLTLTTTAASQSLVRIANRNAANSQVGNIVGSNGFGNSSGTLVTSAIDTAADVNLTITGQLANTGETITLESYIVRVYPKS